MTVKLIVLTCAVTASAATGNWIPLTVAFALIGVVVTTKSLWRESWESYERRARRGRRDPY